MRAQGCSTTVRIGTALLVLSFVAVLAIVVRNAVRYRETAALDGAGDAQRACVLSHALGGYSDVAQRTQALVEADLVLPYRSISKGDTVSFGSYEQGRNTSNGPESIMRIIPNKIGGQFLLLSADVPEARQCHHVPPEKATWENSDLRARTNGDFYDGAFTPAQRGLIEAVHNENADQSITDVSGGAVTDDRVFALSETESVIYLNTPTVRSNIGTAPASVHAVAGPLSVPEDDMADWWLRSSGTYGFATQLVDATGVPSLSGVNVDLQYRVRPVLWINVEGVGEGSRRVTYRPCVAFPS